MNILSAKEFRLQGTSAFAVLSIAKFHELALAGLYARGEAFTDYDKQRRAIARQLRDIAFEMNPAAAKRPKRKAA